ncbi:MAG: integron cassette protein, partial [Gammaproteobacteria bacterium]
MSSLAHGKNTSPVEVTNISAHGIWLLAHGKELFMSYEDFPWFKEQPVKNILN